MDSIQKTKYAQKNNHSVLSEEELRHHDRIRAGREILNSSKNTSSGYKTKTFLSWRFFLVFLFVVVTFFSAWFGYIAFEAYRTSVSITNVSSYTDGDIDFQGEDANPSFIQTTVRTAGSLLGSRSQLRGEKDGYINILLLGKGNERHPGKNLTDTIMIARIDTTNNKIALFSIPRDLYVKIPDTHSATRINALYHHGLQNASDAYYITNAVETITNLPLHYFLIVDFDAFISLVDTLGGVNVMVERDIRDMSYPGPNYSFDPFVIEKGLQHLDGATALKYVRSRHGDPEGDFGRAKRQQQTMQAIKNKAFSLGTMTNPRTISNLLDVLSDNIRTDITLADMTSLLLLTKTLDTQNITTVVLDAWKSDSLLRATHVGRMFALIPRSGRFHYGEIHDQVANIFNRMRQERFAKEINKEKPRVHIVRLGASYSTANVLRELISRTLHIKQSDITITKDSQRSGSGIAIYDHTDAQKPFTLTVLRRLIYADIIQDTHNSTDVDVTIYIGSDVDNRFSASTITQEEFNAQQKNIDHVMIQSE